MGDLEAGDPLRSFSMAARTPEWAVSLSFETPLPLDLEGCTPLERWLVMVFCAVLDGRRLG